MTDASFAAATVESLFAEAGALLDGHFLLKSGRHAGRYLEKFLVLQHPRYGDELSRRLADGMFGENLTTEGVDVNGAVIGERWRIGPRLVLQPTFGRIPCVTFQRKMGEPRWVKTFARSNRPGAYLRVLEPGEVWAGDPVTVEDRPAHGVTIAHAFRAYLTEPERLPELVEIDGLPDDLRETLAERLLRRR